MSRNFWTNTLVWMMTQHAVWICNSIWTQSVVSLTIARLTRYMKSKLHWTILGSTFLCLNLFSSSWFGDYDKLEHKHGYIQWLYVKAYPVFVFSETLTRFPIREYGMNYESQPLQRHEIAAMKADPIVVERIIRSYELMLDFYGMRLVSVETGLVDRCLPPRYFKPRYHNLVRGSFL